MASHKNMQARITNAFDAAAATYDASSDLQQQVAQRLVGFAAEPEAPQTILDIGCGTGHVSALASARWPQARLVALDASKAMLDEARKKVPFLETVQADAVNIGAIGKFDTIFSSMLLHWLPNPGEVLRSWLNLLTPQGRLHVALPVEGSLGAWRDLCHAAKIDDGIWNFPAKNFADGVAHASAIMEHEVTYATPLDFLKNLRNTGATTARSGHTPMPVSAARKLLRLQARPFPVSYSIAYLEGLSVNS